MSLPPAIILAGGKGTRLNPLTDHTPKCWLPVAGKPFIEHLIAYLHTEGVTCTRIAKGTQGTAQAVRDVWPEGSERALILYGDVLVQPKLRNVIKAWDAPGFMVVGPSETPNAVLEGNRITEYGNGVGQWIDAGIGGLTKAVLDRCPDKSDLANIYWHLAVSGELSGVETAAHIHEIGSFAGLSATRQALCSTHAQWYLEETADLLACLPQEPIERLAKLLADVREAGGRVFLLGVGGSAANCSHWVNDLRKMCRIDAATPADNVAELTARTNDTGWESVFYDWLTVSGCKRPDVVIVLSVGGGSETVTPGLFSAIQSSKATGATVVGIVSRDGGVTAKMAHLLIQVPTMGSSLLTAHAETMQSLIGHLLVTHPLLKV